METSTHKKSSALKSWPLFLMIIFATVALLLTSGCAEEEAVETTSERPDPWVTTKVTAKFTADPQINPFKIDVDTQSGVVSLSGEVSSDSDREEAEKLARSTEGVRDVINNLTVKSDDSNSADANAAQDVLITGIVKTKLLADSDLSGLSIDVDTASGVVSLSGTLATKELCEKAEALARETENVVDVINNLTTEG